MPFIDDSVILGQLKFDELLAALFTSMNSTSDFIVDASGTYLLPDPVPFNGTVATIRIFGLFSEDNAASFLLQDGILATPYVCLLMLRQSMESGSYKLVSEPRKFFHTFMPGVLNKDQLNWTVQEGDRIGVVIPCDCYVYEDQTFCPSHINLRAGPDECLSALYYEGNVLEDLNDTIPVGLFQRVQTRLNLEVRIEPLIEPTTDAMQPADEIG